MYFAVAKMGEAPVDGKTDVNPEGLTAACGKWADALRTRLAVADCTCKVLPLEFTSQPFRAGGRPLPLVALQLHPTRWGFLTQADA
jgi:hypothetical protein